MSHWGAITCYKMNRKQLDVGSSKYVDSVITAFGLVEVLKDTGGLTVDQLVERLDIPQSTAYIHIRTLRDLGYVLKDGDRYRLSLRFLDCGGKTRQNMRIFQVSRTHIDELAQEVQEMANLGVEENGQRVLLYKSEPPEGIYDNPPVGEYTRMHWTSLGKALLAYLPTDRVEEIVDTYGLPKATEHTVTEWDVLLDELSQIREQGYAVENEDKQKGIRAISVPLLNEEETPIGAISVSGPKSRFTDERIHGELLEELRNTANVIELAYRHY